MPASKLDSDLWTFYGKQETLPLDVAAWVIHDEIPPARGENRPMPRHVELTYLALFNELARIMEDVLVPKTIPPRWVGGPDGGSLCRGRTTTVTVRRNVRDSATRDELIAWCRAHGIMPAAWFSPTDEEVQETNGEMPEIDDLYSVIGVLLKLMKEDGPWKTQDQIVDAMLARYGRFLKKDRIIKGIFAAANKRINK